LLTSRAEYRLLLRHDNADLRLTQMGYDVGLVTKERYDNFLIKKAQIEGEIERLSHIRLKPTEEIQRFLTEKGHAPLRDGILAIDFLRRPEISYTELMQFAGNDVELPEDVQEQVSI